MTEHTLTRVGDNLRLFTVEPKRGGINSPFNDAVDRVHGTITDQGWPFARWCGYLRGIPPQKIHEMLSIAMNGRNPGALFHVLVRKYKNTPPQ